MRSSVFMASVLPVVVLGCANADSNACASALTASSADAATFCASYTQAANTATTSLPTWATACDSNYKHISSACSCLVPVTLATSTVAAATTAASVSASSASETTSSSKIAVVTSSTKAATTSTKAASSTASPTTTAAATSAAAVGDGTACTVTDASGVSSAVASCTNIVLDGITFAASVALDLSDLSDGTTVTFSGTTTFGYTEDSDFDPITISGNDVTITGATGHTIDGQGALYWDGEGSNGGTDKPDHFIVIKDMTNSKITNLNILNYPVHCFDITGSDGLTIDSITLDNSAGDTDDLGHNTDGFDFSSTDNTVLSNSIVKNQDDCVAITSGTNITVTGMTCSGGHGLSIGSVGGKSNNVVSGITFSDSTVSDSENGCRIKSNADTTGTIENITYSNIVLSGITDYGIDVQQDYLNGGATGDPTDGVTISGVTFTSVTGTMSGSDSESYYVLCGSDSCSDFTFTDVDITGGEVTSTCNFPTTGCPA